jgi:DNA-binding transcriptional regulator YiaG
MMRAEDAAAAFGVSVARVQQWLEEGRVHGRANAEGLLMICAGSFRREARA